uniref:Yippee domain-containing protein n=1 Tax=Strongyloides venezuelensis TaxID=75913 RepID=A0A0K0FAV3_STRVS
MNETSSLSLERPTHRHICYKCHKTCLFIIIRAQKALYLGKNHVKKNSTIVAFIPNFNSKGYFVDGTIVNLDYRCHIHAIEEM